MAKKQIKASAGVAVAEEVLERVFSHFHEHSTVNSARLTEPQVHEADVFIQAGHENAPPGKPEGASGPLGAEREWTPVIADEATRILRTAGVTVIREDASLLRPDRADELFSAKVAVFLHFDGDAAHGVVAGASVGYKGESDRPAAQAWKDIYSTYWPFRWEPDNYTKALSGYYGYRFTNTSDAEFLIEFGDCETLVQARWLKPRLKWLGALLAHFLSRRIGKGNVPLPESPTDERFPLRATAEAEAPFVPAAGNPHSLPDFARDLLSEAQQVPWKKAAAMRQCNGYSGIVRDSLYVFHNLLGMPNGVTSAVFYQSKLAIDNDGTGGNTPGDPHHQDKTSLRDATGVSLDASRDAFAVLPMDAEQAIREHASDPRIALKHPGLPDFTAGLGLKLGDLGIAFWRRGTSGSVQMACFIYGDTGPANKLGEGSVKMAERLGVPSDPNVGGLDEHEIEELHKGVLHIGFPGSGDAFRVSGHPLWTTLDDAQVTARAKELFASFTAGCA